MEARQNLLRDTGRFVEQNWVGDAATGEATFHVNPERASGTESYWFAQLSVTKLRQQVEEVRFLGP